MFENLEDAELWFTQRNFNQASIGLRWVLLTGSCPGKQDSIVLADSKAKMCLWAVGSAKVCVVAFLEPLQRNAAGFCAPGPYNAHLTLS